MPAGREGGNKHNAIPREGFATLSLASGDIEPFKTAIMERFEAIKFEFKSVEKDIKLQIDEIPAPDKTPMDADSQNRFLAMLVGLPHGVMAMSQDIEGLVETSNNVAIIRTEDDDATLYTSTRSSILSALEATRMKIEAISDTAGASIHHHDGYPAWTPNLDSEILKIMKKVYKDLFGKEPKVMAIHAGLECGIIGEKYDGMDMISFGPDLQNPHSPDERIHHGSVERFYQLLAATLKELA